MTRTTSTTDRGGRHPSATHRSRAALAVAVLATGLASLTGMAQAQTSSTVRPAEPSTAASSAAPIDWTDCRDGFECATVEVPLDYDNRGGQQISLDVIRLPAADPGQRIGSLLVNPGGPGGSGVEVVRGLGLFFPLELRASFDIVGFDPRGIIGSTPLRCFDTFEESVSVLPPFAFPVGPEEEKVQKAADRDLAHACEQRDEPILEHMSSADVARDMDTLRGRLGDDQLSFLGWSYGTMLGQIYANMFPDRVRAIVIDGVLDPIAWTTGKDDRADEKPVTTRLRSDVGARRTLNQFFDLCDEAGQDCAFSGDSKRRYDDIADALRDEPVQIVDPELGPVLFTYADLIGSTLGALYSPSSWPDFAEFLAYLESEVTPVELGQALAAVRGELGLRPAAQEPYPNYVEGFPSVLCSDSINPDRFGAWSRAAAQTERRRGYFGPLWTWASSICHAWPTTAGEDRYLGPWSASTASPVLVVGNDYDPATRYHGAVKAAGLLPNSRLLTYAGWGHTAFLTGNFCVDTTVTHYLVTTDIPAPGTVCQPQGSPFGPIDAETRARDEARAAAGLPVLPDVIRRALT